MSDPAAPADAPKQGSALAARASGAAHLRSYREHQATLFAIAYRMLGSVADAEDMLQDTFLRWQQTTVEEVQSPRAFLVTILTRLCINYLESAKVRREEYFGQWLPEPLLEDFAAQAAERAVETDESLSMAFLVLLECLTPPERAVFLLREVLDYDYADIAKIVNQTPSNCRQLLRRARQHVSYKRARFVTSHEQREQLIREFLRAVAGGDLQGLVALLSQEAVLHSDGGGKAPSLPVPIVGGAKIARALLGASRKLVPKNLEQRLVLINGALGVASYLNGRIFSVLNLDISEGRILRLYIISNPDKLRHLDRVS
jgi:RNA polymerase sigma-70 factor (ECF subfamily)